MKKNILITGSSGLLAKNINLIINKKNLDKVDNYFFHTRNLFDLKDFNALSDYITGNKIDEIIHTAARVGGIFDNLTYPYDYAYENLVMDQNIIKCSIDTKINNLIVFGSTCMYPNQLQNEDYPLSEKHIYQGEPTQSNFSYANSKRSLISSIDAAHKQYGLNYTALIPTNLYGYFDHYFFDEENRFSTHFVASAVSKILHAKKNSIPEVNFFGSGKPLRQYLFTEDLARLVLEISQSDPLNDYFNVSNSENLEIKELAEFIAKTFNYTGSVVFDNNIKYDGQFRKDVTSKKLVNTITTKFTNFENGIYLTKKWLENYNELVIN
jgi:GDP-L-fucose synthase